MKRPVFLCALLLSTAAALTAQQSKTSDPYAGVSNPPPDDTITIPEPQPQPKAKPSPAHPMVAAPQPAAKPVAPSSADAGAPADNAPSSEKNITVPDIVTGPDADNGSASNTSLAPQSVDGTDSGVVRVEPTPAPAATSEPTLSRRDGAAGSDGDIVHVQPDVQAAPAPVRPEATAIPDGDIVHPAPLPPGTLAAGTTIRARLLEGLSTAYAQDGEKFRARVASDVLDSAGNVVIPTGAEIDGTVGQISTGHFAGHGSMLLHPQTVILPNGSHFRLYAQLSGTPGSNTNVGGEGDVTPGARVRKGEIEYGGGVGVGAVTGAVLGGPVGALAGSLVGASLVTVHLLMDHPQATLDSGTVLLFNLTEQLHMVADSATGAAE